MGVELDRALAYRAGRQDGVVTRSQCVAIGFSQDEVDAMLRNERLHRVHRGVYHVGHASLSDRARLRAALFAVGKDAAISHRTAAALWEILPWDGYPELTTTLRSQNRPKGLIVHRVHRAPQTTGHQGFRLTTPEQTLLDLASLPISSKQLSRALGEAEYQRIIDRDRLKQLAAGRKGALAVREALGEAPSATHSSLEDASLSLLRRAELPQPDANAWIGRRQVDFLWPAERVIVETDGWAAHGRRDSFDRDRERDLDFEARGYRTARVSERNLRRKPLAQLVRVGALLLGGQ
ncbi:MAG: type IV toxin-antitoxin system AbiEi family antitoxin domain-containing protein [Solirubrobacteraceae bacterium]